MLPRDGHIINVIPSLHFSQRFPCGRKEYPHTDIIDRAEDLFNLIRDASEGKTMPTMSIFDCRMIGLYLTTVEPMRSFVDDMQEMEGKNGILSVSLAHCFPWSDVPTCGAKALVTQTVPLHRMNGGKLSLSKEGTSTPINFSWKWN